MGDHDTCSPGLCGLCPLPGFAFGRRPLGRTGPCPTGPPPSWRYRDASQGRNKAVAGGLGVGGLAINCVGGASGVALYSNKNLDDENADSCDKTQCFWKPNWTPVGSLWLHPASDFRIPNAVDGKTLAVEGPRTSTGFSGFSIMNPAWPFLFG